LVLRVFSDRGTLKKKKKEGRKESSPKTGVSKEKYSPPSDLSIQKGWLLRRGDISSRKAQQKRKKRRGGLCKRREIPHDWKFERYDAISSTSPAQTAKKWEKEKGQIGKRQNENSVKKQSQNAPNAPRDRHAQGKRQGTRGNDHHKIIGVFPEKMEEKKAQDY